MRKLGGFDDANTKEIMMWIIGKKQRNDEDTAFFNERLLDERNVC